jgi:hypothetical protein
VLYTLGLALVLVIGGLANRRTEPVLAWMAVALLALGFLSLGWGFLAAGDGAGALGALYLAALSWGLGFVLALIFGVGFLRDPSRTPATPLAPLQRRNRPGRH